MPKSRQRKKSGKKRSKLRHGPDMRAVVIRQVAHYPLRECRINDDWRESRMASIIIARNRPDGRVAIGAFAVDAGCLGVKSAFANPGISVRDYEDRFVRGAAVPHGPCDPAFAVKLIRGAVEYAKGLGFNPDPDYYYACEIFGGIDPASCQETIEYGKDGKPFYCAGPYDDVEAIMEKLTRTLGPNGFHFVIPFGPPDMFDFDDDEPDEEW